MYGVHNHAGRTGPGFLLELCILNFSHPCYYCDLCCYDAGDWKKLVQTCRARGMLGGFPKIGGHWLHNIFCTPNLTKKLLSILAVLSARKKKKKSITSFILC